MPKQLNILIEEQLYEWINKEYPKKVGEIITTLLIAHKEEVENKSKRITGLNYQNGFIEYSPGKWVEEKNYERVGTILAEIKDSKKIVLKSNNYLKKE